MRQCLCGLTAKRRQIRTRFSEVVELSEDFTDGSDYRDASRQKAVEAFAGWEASPHTAEGLRAVAVDEIWLAAVAALPDIDQSCADEKLAAHDAENDNRADKIAKVAWTRAEVAYFTCQNDRSRLQFMAQACKDEALSYLVPNRRPPLDSCVWRATQQVTRRRP